MFYVYYFENKFITINGLKISKSNNIEKAAYWINKRKAKTWEDAIKRKYPNAKLREATLTLK